jgi:hypothetical protein
MRGRGEGYWGSYIAHAHLNSGEDAEVVLREVAKGVHIKLHGVLLLLAAAARADHPMIFCKKFKVSKHKIAK